MSADCVCNPSARVNILSGAYVGCTAVLSKTAATNLIGTQPVSRLRAGVTQPASAALHSSGAVQIGFADISKSLAASLSGEFFSASPVLDTIVEVESVLTATAAGVTAAASCDSSVSSSILWSVVSRRQPHEIVRNAFAAVSGDTRIRARAAKHLHSQVELIPPQKENVVVDGTRQRNANIDIVITPAVMIVADRIKNVEAELEGSASVVPFADVGDMRVFISAETDVGVRTGSQIAMFRASWWYTPPYTPVFVDMKQKHEAEVCICCKARLTAVLAGPSGKLTELGTKKHKKLRIIYKEHPDSTVSKPKYFSGLAVTEDEEATPCVCANMYVGMYTTNNEVWRVGQERPVVMFSFKYGPFFQYVEESNFRVVMVKNYMYDIRFQGPSEIPRFVLFTGGCGSSYMLINAECE